MKKDIVTEMYEKKMKEKKNKELGCKFIRINPDEREYDENVEFSEINNHISESDKKVTEESTKKSLIEKISERLIKLEVLKKSLNKIKMHNVHCQKKYHYYKTWCKID